MSSRAFQRATADPVAVANAATPPGAIAAFAFGAAPTGWLKANGAAVSRATYSALFAAVGTTFGAGDGSTTFNLPDLRGEFVRGHDDGRGVDAGRTLGSAQAADVAPHNHTASTSVASASAGTPSGSIASGGAHTHNVNTIATSSGVSGANGVGSDHGTGTAPQSAAAASDGAHSHTFTGSTLAAHGHTATTTVNNSTGTENRPRNVAALYCIKA